LAPVRALAAVVAVLILVVAVAAGSAVAATTVGGTFATAPGAAVAYWTPARRAAAEPMSVLPVSPAGALGGSPLLGASAMSTGADPPTSASPRVTTSSVEGVDTGDSTLFPNRANGIVYGEYLIEGKAEDYQCSGSVIHSPQGDIVLTAGHCVIDPETGAVARRIVFLPGYREGEMPFGVFAASSFVTTPEWSSTAGTSDPDEAGDLALLVLAASTETGQTVEATVGALSIAFEQAREETYTQWGYPGESPYNGEILYSHTTPYAGGDPFYPAAERPIKIASDFTAGASGGPWTIGPASAPTVLSLTDYYYEGDPHHLYGAYFGSAARNAYEAAAGVVVPPVTTAVPTEPTVPAAATPAPTPAVSPPAATPTPTPTPAPSPATGSLRIVAAHARSTQGEATIVVHLGGPGTLRLSGPAVRTVSVVAEVASNYRLAVSAKVGGAAARALRLRGSVTVGVGIRFTSPVGVRHTSRLVSLFTRPN
jgi:V8-like Glu-specific endopeptidase